MNNNAKAGDAEAQHSKDDTVNHVPGPLIATCDNVFRKLGLDHRREFESYEDAVALAEEMLVEDLAGIEESIPKRGRSWPTWKSAAFRRYFLLALHEVLYDEISEYLVEPTKEMIATQRTVMSELRSRESPRPADDEGALLYNLEPRNWHIGLDIQSSDRRTCLFVFSGLIDAMDGQEEGVHEALVEGGVLSPDDGVTPAGALLIFMKMRLSHADADERGGDELGNDFVFEVGGF